MLAIEYVPISTIKPYAGNAKRHPAEQVEQIKKSIEEFGFNDPIATWNGEIVEGHGRFIAASEMGLDTVPVIRLDGLTDAQRKAYTLVHNKLTLNSGFDPDLLSLELLEIEQDIDMSEYGFDADDIFGDDEWKAGEEPSLKRNVFENQTTRQFDTDNWYGIPAIEATHTKGNKLLRFCDFNQVTDHENYIAHCVERTRQIFGKAEKIQGGDISRLFTVYRFPACASNPFVLSPPMVRGVLEGTGH